MKQLFLLLFSSLWIGMSAQSIALRNDSAVVDEDFSSELDLRLNPEFDANLPKSKEYSCYPFLSMKDNHIIMNGRNWDTLRRRLSQGILFGPPFSIVHIGDSHIQADGATGVARSVLQTRFGNAGRGFITPLKMAGTNEPRDYAITSTSRWHTAKLLKTPWAAEMQFSGVAISPVSRSFNVSISTLTRTLVTNPFSEVRIFYEGGRIIVDSAESRGRGLFFVSEYSEGYLSILLTESVTDITLEMHSDAEVTIAGFELLDDSVGLLYNAIGNNGATFSAYNSTGKMDDVSVLSPDLVILSMGANEAFGKVSDEEFKRAIDETVREISAAVPAAEFLLVTPMECQRRTGRSRRKTSYALNSNVGRLRNAMLEYGREKGIPVYDFYAVAGGFGASSKWLADELLSRDRVHNTWTGYDLQGRLLADALVEALLPSTDSL